jgi:ribosomal protein L7/L12
MSRLRQKLRLSLKEVKTVAEAGPIELASRESAGAAYRLAEEFQQLGAEVEVFISSTGHAHEL